jgi:alpha-N-acetylglucosaminidase
MGNIRGWGGPLSSAWHTRSLILQKQILQRLRELGMIPVLPAFAGHLPRAFKR